jgi:hypothetical protein
MAQKPPLDGKGHPIAGIHKTAESAIPGDDAMTGNDDGKPVCATRLPYRTRSRIQFRGNIRVASRCTARYGFNGAPYPALMKGAADMER